MPAHSSGKATVITHVTDDAGSAQPASLWRRVQRRIRGRLFRIFGHGLYATLGRSLNGLRSPFMIGYRPDFHMRRDFAEYGPLRKAWTRNNWANNGGDFTRFYALYQNVRQVLDDGVEGALVELGVYKGNSAAVLAGLGRATGRQTYLFDTFDGFDVRDLKGIDERHPVQFTNTSLASVRALVGEDAVTYVPGFFPDTLKDIEPISAIAVAHVDCDLHDPMKAALEAFYPLVSPGGLIIMHDYSSGFWPGATRAVDDFFRTRPEKPVLIPDKSGRAIVRKV